MPGAEAVPGVIVLNSENFQVDLLMSFVGATRLNVEHSPNARKSRKSAGFLRLQKGCFNFQEILWRRVEARANRSHLVRIPLLLPNKTQNPDTKRPNTVLFNFVFSAFCTPIDATNIFNDVLFGFDLFRGTFWINLDSKEPL